MCLYNRRTLHHPFPKPFSVGEYNGRWRADKIHFACYVSIMSFYLLMPANSRSLAAYEASDGSFASAAASAFVAAPLLP